MRSLFLQCSLGFDFELSAAYAPDDMMEAPVLSGFHTRDTVAQGADTRAMRPHHRTTSIPRYATPAHAALVCIYMSGRNQAWSQVQT